MSAHTPGPWTLRDLPTTHGRYIGPAHDGGASSVAFVVSSVSRPETELDANARLIAAAPDLLEALERLLSAVQRSVCDGSGPAQDAAHAAIAKATGVKP